MTGDREQSSARMPLLLLGLGLLSLFLLVVNNSIRERLLLPNAEAARLVAEVGTRIATLHLWVEEYVSGDTVDLDEVREHQVESRRLLARLSGEVDGAKERPLDLDQESLDLLDLLQPQVDRFVELSSQRLAGFDAGEEVGVGSPIDVAYDGVFYALLGDLRRLEESVNSRFTAAHDRSTNLFRLMLIAWTAIILFAVIAVWTHERHKREAQEALAESQAALLQAQKMEAIGSLAGGLAHDINNYLAAISAQCEVVRMKVGDGDPLGAKMTTVIETTARASALLERLMAFSRGRTTQPEAVDLNGVARDLEDMARRLIGETIELRLDLEPDLWPVELSISQVEQAVVNLLVNARDAMPEGGRVVVATRNVDATDSPLPQAGDAVALRISDTGPGIPPELREKVFEPFFTTKGKARNSGLGLATVYGIAQQGGGVVRLIETDRPGAHIELCFPRTDKIPEAAMAPLEEDSAAVGGRVLLVEDNEELRTSSRELLAAMGFDVVAADSGESALVIFDEDPHGFDLLMTDVVMPGINGKELAERVEAADPKIQVLFASGYTDSVILRTGIDEGSINFLPKPFSAGQLSTAIRRVLGPAARGGGRPAEPVGEPRRIPR